MAKSLYLQSESAWINSYKVFSGLINKNQFKIGVEVGVAHGGHSLTILEKTKVKKLYCIDPYKHIKGYDDPMNISQKAFDLLFIQAQNRLSHHASRVEFIRKPSKLAAQKIQEPLDFVYLDGDHSYEGVATDLISWYCKIRIGGIIGGHDYNHPNFPGVKKATESFFFRFGYRINVGEGGVWWVKKTAQPISYVVPMYNAEATIKKSIESIQSNLEPGDEIVVVDDNSQDSSTKIVEGFKNLPLKLISHKNNMGGGAARNTAVQHSHHQLIFCLDSDNQLYPGSVSKLKSALESSFSDVACFQTWRYYKDNQMTHTWELKQDAGEPGSYFSTYRVPGASGNYLYTRTCYDNVGGYPTNASALDTWGFGLAVAMAGYSTQVVKGYYLHRYGHNSYYSRESRKRNLSLQATKLMVRYLNRIILRDVIYILLHPHSWFDKLETRPIYLRDST